MHHTHTKKIKKKSSSSHFQQKLQQKINNARTLNFFSWYDTLGFPPKFANHTGMGEKNQKPKSNITLRPLELEPDITQMTELYDSKFKLVIFNMLGL